MTGVLNDDQLREFAEQGYVLLPGAVPRDVVEAATATVDELVEGEPPGDGVRGPHFYFPEAADEPSLIAPLTGTGAWEAAESLSGAGTLEEPWQVQVPLNIPPFLHLPGIPHIDGFPPLPDGRPATFTMLGGVLLSDQLDEDAGNLWIWPGSHLTHAAYFREKGPDAFFDAAGYPPLRLPERPVQLRGRAGDLLLAHYLLGHNIGGNTSGAVRRALY